MDSPLIIVSISEDMDSIGKYYTTTISMARMTVDVVNGPEVYGITVEELSKS